jgi:hypothetical protein
MFNKKTKIYKFFSRFGLRKVILIFVVFVVIQLMTPVLVLDGETFLPITGDKIIYRTYGWNGCSETSTAQSSMLSFHGPLVFRCHLTVQKSGYHDNGVDYFNLPSILFRTNIIILNKKIINTDIIEFHRVFTKSDLGMDALTYLSDSSLEVSPEQMEIFKKFDFKFSEHHGKVGSNTIAPISGAVKFFGEGGVQKIGSYGDQNVRSFFEMENLLTAPLFGYKSEMTLESQQAYVARLRDGKHYMKFKTHFTIEGSNYNFCINGFIAKKESRNLEVSEKRPWGCTRDINESLYDRKIAYRKLQKLLANGTEVIFARKTRYKNNYKKEHVDIFIQEDLEKMSKDLIFSSKDKRNSYKLMPISNGVVEENPDHYILDSSLIGKIITGILPSFEKLPRDSETAIPVEIFIAGKPLDPLSIKTEYELNSKE